MSGPVLDLRDLRGGFTVRDNYTEVLHGVSFAVEPAVVTALVGETGSGKSITVRALTGLGPPGFAVAGGSARLDGRELVGMGEDDLRAVRGRGIAMVFQDARAALNPVFTIGTQLADVARLHGTRSRQAAVDAAVQMLDRVRIPDPRRRMRQYPHQFSGGMAQRVTIALALLCHPRLLVLDEPTTGLDVTIQADILDLIRDITVEEQIGVCLITHDLGVVGALAEHVVVLRNGTVVVDTSAETFFDDPGEQYARALLDASRRAERRP
jgi:ABC-type glutathione transport system ATPase component